MLFQEFKKPDGTYEMRLRPEDALDCNEIDDCKKCVFDDDPEEMCDSRFDFGNIINPISNLQTILENFGIPLVNLSDLNRPPRETNSIEKISGKEAMERFGFQVPAGTTPEIFKKQEFGIKHQLEARLFKIENGKVIADPETIELMRQSGVLDEIEKSFRAGDN